MREEQRKLEMINLNQRESVHLNNENIKKKRLIEEKLSQLAEAERWHRELLQRYQLQQRALANANQGIFYFFLNLIEI